MRHTLCFLYIDPCASQWAALTIDHPITDLVGGCEGFFFFFLFINYSEPIHWYLWESQHLVWENRLLLGFLGAFEPCAVEKGQDLSFPFSRHSNWGEQSWQLWKHRWQPIHKSGLIRIFSHSYPVHKPTLSMKGLKGNISVQSERMASLQYFMYSEAK